MATCIMLYIAEGSEPDTARPVNVNETYFAVVKALFGDKTFLFDTASSVEMLTKDLTPPQSYVAFEIAHEGSKIER